MFEELATSRGGGKGDTYHVLAPPEGALKFCDELKGVLARNSIALRGAAPCA